MVVFGRALSNSATALCLLCLLNVNAVLATNCEILGHYPLEIKASGKTIQPNGKLFAACWEEKFLILKKDKKAFGRAKRELARTFIYADNEAAGQKPVSSIYRDALLGLPSYITAKKYGEAFFGSFFGGELRPLPKMCSVKEKKDWTSGLLQILAISYDAAVNFYPFEHQQTGLTVPDAEIARIKEGVACIQAFFSKVEESKGCVDTKKYNLCFK